MSGTIDSFNTMNSTPAQSPTNADTYTQSATDEPDSSSTTTRPKRSKRKSPPVTVDNESMNKSISIRRTSRQAANNANNAIMQSNNNDIQPTDESDNLTAMDRFATDYKSTVAAEETQSDPPYLQNTFMEFSVNSNSGVYVAPDGSIDRTLYCICKQPYNPIRAMIGCDKCQDWFHTSCIGLSTAVADKLDVWYCDKCKNSVSATGNTGKQKKSSAGKKNRSLTANDLIYDTTQYYTINDNQLNNNTINNNNDVHSDANSDTMDEVNDDEYIDTPQYKANGRPVRSAAPTTSLKEIDTINEYIGSGSKSSQNKPSRNNTTRSNNRMNNEQRNARVSMLRSRNPQVPNSTYISQSYSIRRRASRIAVLSDGNAVRLRVTYDGFDVLESDEYDTYDYLGEEFLVVEHDVDELNNYWNGYSMIDNDDTDDVYISSDDSDLDIQHDIGVPFNRPEAVDSDGNIIKTESNHTDTTDGTMSDTTVKNELVNVDDNNDTLSHKHSATRIKSIYDNNNRVIYRLKQRYVDVNGISDEYDDLGWNSIIQQNASDTQSMNATETDIKLLKYMEQRAVDIECILLELEMSKRRLYTAIAYSYINTMKLIGSTQPKQLQLSPDIVRVGKRRGGVSSFVDDKLSDGSQTPLQRVHTPGTPKTSLRRRKSLLQQFPKITRRNSVGQLYSNDINDDSDDETPLYCDMLECSGCRGRIPATQYYMHIKSCSITSELDTRTDRAIYNMQPSIDMSQYQTYGVPQPLPTSSYPWSDSTLDIDDIYVNRLSADELINKYDRLETSMVCGCPLNDNVDHTVDIHSIEYCDRMKSDCTEHILWVDQWRCNIETQYYISLRRLELLQSEIESCKHRLYNRYNIKGLLLFDNIDQLLLIQNDAIADAANVPQQIQQQQITLHQQATNDLNELQVYQNEFKEKYMQQVKELEQQVELQLLESMEPPSAVPSIQNIHQQQQQLLQQQQQHVQQYQYAQQQQHNQLMSPHNQAAQYYAAQASPHQQIYTATAVDDIHSHLQQQQPLRTYSNQQSQSAQGRASSNPLDQSQYMQQHNQQQQQLSQWDQLRVLQQQLQHTPSVNVQQQYNQLLSPQHNTNIQRQQHQLNQPQYQYIPPQHSPHNNILQQQQQNNMSNYKPSQITSRSPLIHQQLPPLQPQQQQPQYNPQSSHIQYSTPQLKPPQSIQQHTGQSPLILQPVQQPTI